MTITKNSLSRQLPDFIGQDPYISELLQSKAAEYASLDEFRIDLQKQMFVDTATWGLILWEKALKLPTNTNDTELVLIEEDNPALKLHGTWSTIQLADEDINFDVNKGVSNGISVKADASDKANWIEYTFWGTGVRLIRSSVTNYQSACTIYLDNNKYTANNVAVNIPSYNEVFFEIDNLKWGIHTIRVTFDPIKNSVIQNRYFVLDRIEVTNLVANGYDKRRAIIKAKLTPIRKVTNQTIKDLAATYGFNDIAIDEKTPYVYKIDFDYNANADYELRKKLLIDLKKLIPAHIELYNKYLVSTFYDIAKLELTWDEMKQTYVWYDFLDESSEGPISIFYQLNKYLDLSVFNYKSFNSDTNLIDVLIYRYYYENLHSATKVPHKNLNYTINYNGVVDNAGTSSYFSELNRKLLYDSERLQLANICTMSDFYDTYPTFSQVINKYAEIRTRLKNAVNNHPYLKYKGVNVTSDTLHDILVPIDYFAGDVTFPTVTEIPAYDVRKDKIAYDGTNYVTGTIPDFDVANAFVTLPANIGGFNTTDTIYVPADYSMPIQADLVPANIKVGTTFFGVSGTAVTVASKYNKDDYLFPWQLDSISGDTNNFKIKY